MLGHHVTHPAARSAALGLLGLAVAGLACGGGGDGGPPVPVSVTVTSPIGNRMARGRTVQLVAVAVDARGNVVAGTAFTWSSTLPGVADVNPSSGLVTGVSEGNATISATAAGLTGSVPLEVRDVNLAGIGAAVSDPFTVALAANLTPAVRGPVQAALADCATGATQGNFTTIETCIASGRAQVAAAVDETDKVLLAFLALFFDYFEVLLAP